MAPSALTVFVSKLDDTFEMRRKFINKYGVDDEGNWPKMPDGSRMMFVPILQGYINDDDIKNQLYEQLALQALTKSGEIKMNLNLVDIKEKKSYLNNKSMEQIVHELHSKDNDQIPIFKHITKKWSRNVYQEDYEIAIDPKLEIEATNTLKNLKKYLLDNFPGEVRRHFSDYQGAQYANGLTQNGNYTSQKANIDDDTKDFILKMNHNNKYSKCLIEGIELVDRLLRIEGRNNTVGSIIQDEKDSVSKNHQQNTAHDEKLTTSLPSSKDELMSTITNGDSISTIDRADDAFTHLDWSEITIYGDIEKLEPANENEQRITKNTFGRKHVTAEELENWKQNNWEQIRTMARDANYKEYSTLKRILHGIQTTRKCQIEQSNIPNNTKENHATTGEIEQRASHPLDTKSPSTPVEESDEGQET